MPKPSFSKESFQKANQAAKERGGGFSDIENGLYVATIEKAKLERRDSGSEQVSFGWQISEEDERHPNQYIWWNQNILTKDGQPNEIGLQIVNSTFIQLSEGQFDFDDLEFDGNGECTNFENVIERFFGTKARIKVTKDGEYNGKPQYKIFPNRVIRNAYQDATNGTKVKQPETAPTEELEQPAQTQEAPQEPAVRDNVEVRIGAAVMYPADTVAQNVQAAKRGRVISYVDSPEDSTKGIARVKPTARTDDTFTEFTKAKEEMVTSDDLVLVGKHKGPEILDMKTLEPVSTPTEVAVVEEEEILDEAPTPTMPKLEKGLEVSYGWEGKTLKGPIHEVNEDEGFVKIVATNAEGKKVARKVQIDDLVAPF